MFVIASEIICIKKTNNLPQKKQNKKHQQKEPQKPKQRKQKKSLSQSAPTTHAQSPAEI